MEDNNFDRKPNKLMLGSELIHNNAIKTDSSFTVSHLDSSRQILIETPVGQSSCSPERFELNLAHGLPSPSRPASGTSGFVAVYVKEEPSEEVAPFPASYNECSHQALIGTSVEQNLAFPEKIEPKMTYGLPSVPRSAPSASPNEFVAVYIKEEPTEDMNLSSEHFMDSEHHFSPTIKESSISSFGADDIADKEDIIKICQPPDLMEHTKEIGVEECSVDNKPNFAPTIEATSISSLERINAKVPDDVANKENTLKNNLPRDFTNIDTEMDVEGMHYENGFLSCFKQEEDEVVNTIADVTRIPGNNSEQIDNVVNESVSFDSKQRSQLLKHKINLKFGSVINSRNTHGVTVYFNGGNAQNTVKSVLNKKMPSFEQIPTTSKSRSGLKSRNATSKDRRFSCNKCSSTFTRQFNLKTHLMTHSDKKDFVCEQCSAQFHLKSGLDRHLLTHTNEKAFSCTQCPARFSQKFHLSRHLLTHSNEQVFSCEQCSLRFTRKDHLKQHMVKHSNEKAFFCNICSAQFKRKDCLKRHLITHSNKKSFSCDQCSARFKHKCNLNQHMLTHSDEKAFNCNLCSAKFKRKGYLKDHLLIHSGKRFSCEQCSAQFSQKNNLKQHLLTHSDEKTFSCDECSDRFTRKRDLQLHVLSHSNQKVFSCNECSAWFKRKFNLKEHILTHSNEKSFICDVCSAQFVTQAYLTRHLLVHSSEKAFSCNQCSLRFKFKSSLRKHCLKYHAKEASSVR